MHEIKFDELIRVNNKKWILRTNIGTFPDSAKYLFVYLSYYHWIIATAIGYFIRLFGSLLKSINALQAFNQFEGKELLSDFPSKSSFQNMKNIHPNRHL